MNARVLCYGVAVLMVFGTLFRTVWLRSRAVSTAYQVRELRDEEAELKNAMKGEAKLDADGDEEKKDEAEDALTKAIQEHLSETIGGVRYTTRLTDSPVCLVSGEFDPGANLERILKASGQAMPEAKRILEVNPKHPLVQRLDSESDEQKLGNWAAMLFEQALLAEGGRLDDPAAFVKRMNDMLLEMSAG